MAPPFLTSALYGASRPGCFTRLEATPGTHWIGDWVGPIAGPKIIEKRKFSFSCRKSYHGRPSHRSSYYRLSYPDSAVGSTFK
jgi:hypothetical protein